MPKNYTQVPTPQQWAKDMGVTGFFSKTAFPAYERISELLGMYSTVDSRLKELKYEILMQIYRHTSFIRKYKDNQAKLGTTLGSSSEETVLALEIYLEKEHKLNAQKFVTEFGVDVWDEGRDEDQLHKNSLQWYETKAARRQFKISWRNGLAYRWSFTPDGKKGEKKMYDTDAYMDAIENNMSLYVMDTFGRLYVSGKETQPGFEKSLKHSSFLAGATVLAAGTIRFKQGKLVCISGKSGHYKPKVRQMLNVLERLRAVQVDLTHVTVYRENYTSAFQNSNPRNFEPIAAGEFLYRRAWPVFPEDMFVS